MQKHALKFTDLLPSDLPRKETGISFSGFQGWKLSPEIVLVFFFFFPLMEMVMINYCNFSEVP